MKIRSIISEAARNITTGTSRAVLFMLISVLSMLAFAGFDISMIHNIEQQSLARIQAYADTSAVVGGAVDGKSCDGLAGLNDVSAYSGGLRQSRDIALVATPGKTISSYEVTPGFLRMLVLSDESLGTSSQASSRIDARGVWISRLVSRDFGLVKGSTLYTSNGTVRVAGVFSWPNDGRDTRLGYAIISVGSSSRNYDECWVKQWPNGQIADSQIMATLVISSRTSDNSSIGITRINKGYDSHFNPHELFRHRISRFAPLIVFALGILVGLFSVHRRRLEYAGALHAGQTKLAQVTEILCETIVWTIVAQCAVLSICTVYCLRFAQTGGVEMLLAALRGIGAYGSGTLLGAATAGVLIKQSQLFTYFKTR